MFIRLLLIVVCILVANLLPAADAPDIDEQTRAIAQELRCVVCQNLSVADSPSEMAQQMRGIVKEQLQAGKTPQEVKDFFVSKYGEWVLLAPTAQGFSLLLWVLPFVVLITGVGFALWLVRRWSTKKKTDTDSLGNSGAADPGPKRSRKRHHCEDKPGGFQSPRATPSGAGSALCRAQGIGVRLSSRKAGRVRLWDAQARDRKQSGGGAATTRRLFIQSAVPRQIL